jgi:rhamnogalacturonan endolyase
VNGQTRSKFYSSERFIDDHVHCVYRDNDAIHACILLNSQSYEGSSGGPFFRDINANNAGEATNLYFYMNSGHVQTEKYRMGLHGPYALSFSRSGIPSGKTMDTSFFEGLGVTGYVGANGRGFVSGTATGVASGFASVLHWYNDNAQYWAYASASGSFTSPAMKPGTYTQVLYQGELKVAASSVSVSAGKTTTANIAAANSARKTIWQMGDWDGTPKGFRNADKQLRMHPSDNRMSSWGPLTYTVGSSSLDSVPMALFKDVNTPLTIKFTLSSSQLGAATLRIGTTLSFAGARPSVSVNSWNGPTPAAPTKIDSRGVTRGAYRGFGEAYDFKIPAGTLLSGSNTVTIYVASGSSGDKYLAPNVILDAIELFQ